MDYDGATNRAKGCCVKVEGAIGVFPSRHGRGNGGLEEKVESELGLWEELVPKVLG